MKASLWNADRDTMSVSLQMKTSFCKQKKEGGNVLRLKVELIIYSVNKQSSVFREKNTEDCSLARTADKNQKTEVARKDGGKCNITGAYYSDLILYHWFYI